ncbi:MAG: hypothetical protein FWF81_04240 [Defluviitaleaceae bacterium]|nr:hypothetical protein [Defluviitaleaceae bacterium]
MNFYSMNFNELREIVHQIKDIKIIGRTTNLGAIICHVMGLALEADGKLKLYILEYDEAFQMAGQEIGDVYTFPDTNRASMIVPHHHLNPSPSYINAEKLCIGEHEFTITQSGNRSISLTHSCIDIVLFTQFMNAGWYPEELQDKEFLRLTEITLQTECNAIPDIDIHSAITVTMHPAYKRCMVEKPIRLTIGENFPKIYFTDKESGKELWVQINRVYLYDIWEGMETSLNEAIESGLLKEEALAEYKIQIEKTNQALCPRGMYFFAIEYESKDSIAFDFHSKQWLESPPHRGDSHSLVFVSDAEIQLGKLGTKLITALIQEPVSRDTKEMDAEIFSYTETIIRNCPKIR